MNEEAGPNVKKCKNCFDLEKKIMQLEQKNMNLIFENKKLKDALNNNNHNLMHSCKNLNHFFIFFDRFSIENSFE